MSGRHAEVSKGESISPQSRGGGIAERISYRLLSPSGFGDAKLPAVSTLCQGLGLALQHKSFKVGQFDTAADDQRRALMDAGGLNVQDPALTIDCHPAGLFG